MSGHIQIQAICPHIQYVSDGTNNTFEFSFAIFHDKNIEVYIDNQKQDAGFTILWSGETGGGSISFINLPQAGSIITIRRQLLCERITDFHESGEFRAKAINDQLDYLTALIQQVQAEVSRCLRISPTDRESRLTLPRKESRALHTLGFDENGDLSTRPLAALSAAPLSLDVLPAGEINVHFSTADREKLSTIAPRAEPNPPVVTAIERSVGDQTQVRSFAPFDIREMIRIQAPLPTVQRVFGRTGDITARSGDYTAEQISDTSNKCIMTKYERDKLLNIEENAQENAVHSVMGMMGSVSLGALPEATNFDLTSTFAAVFDGTMNIHRKIRLSAMLLGASQIDGGAATTALDSASLIDGGNANA